MISQVQVRCLLLVVAALVVEGPAWGQGQDGETAPSIEGEADDLPQRELTLGDEGEGIHVSSRITVRPSLDLAVGYQPNVYYRDSAEYLPVMGVGILRLGAGATIATEAPQVGIDSASGGTVGQKVALNGNLHFGLHEYFSSDADRAPSRDVSVAAMMDAVLNPEGSLSINVRDGFIRVVSPPTRERGPDLGRDKNEVTAGVIYRPPGSGIESYANYTFGLDLFEGSQLDLANRTWHTLSVGARWQWLPMTQFVFDGQLGSIAPTNDTGALKSGSMPLRIRAGASTLLTPLMGIVLKVGYGNGFYDAGPSFGSYLAVVEARYALAPAARLAVGYSHDFEDSMFSNYYTDHAFFGRLSAQLGGLWQVSARGEVRYRTYDGIPNTLNGFTFCGNASCTTDTRTDLIARTDARADFTVNQWLLVGASYALMGDWTDFFSRAPTGEIDSGSYVWHELVGTASAKF